MGRPSDSLSVARERSRIQRSILCRLHWSGVWRLLYKEDSAWNVHDSRCPRSKNLPKDALDLMRH